MQVHREPWSEDAAAALAPALGPYAEAVAAEVRGEVCELWNIPGHGYLVTRIECDPQYRPQELVLVAASGRDALPVLRWFRANVARPMGCRWMRVHSRRPGMGRYLQPEGFAFDEAIFRAEV